MKSLRLAVVVVALVAFGLTGVALAADYYVVKKGDAMSVVDQKPADEKSIVKGPFKTKDEAEKAMKAAAPTKKPAKLPTSGC